MVSKLRTPSDLSVYVSLHGTYNVVLKVIKVPLLALTLSYKEVEG